MNRKQNPNESYADYSGYESSTLRPERMDSRERYRHDRDQNLLHNRHGRESSYRAHAEFDTTASRKPSMGWENLPSGELSYEEQYRTDGEAHNFRKPLDEDRFGEYPRYGKSLNRTAHSRKNYAGIGPKGYKRADTRIEEEVCEVLARDNDIDASDMVVKVMDGVVTLAGTVRDREDRFAAERLVEGILGVEDIQNDLKVSRKNSQEQSSLRTSTTPPSRH
ncbi:MAG: BON domain-containing protein [Bacteriovorax sp.]|jgi:hypothetical protein